MNTRTAVISKTFDVYDFDRTIYNGNSAVDFYVFCLKNRPILIKYLPYQLWHLSLFILKLEQRTDFKSRFFVFLSSMSEIENIVNDFWKAYDVKIKKWYLEEDHQQDIIISASPDFLLRPIFDALGAHTLIATGMNTATGVISGVNCYGIEKVVRLREEIVDINIDKVFSDSLSDLPLFELAKSAYVVVGNTIYTLQDYNAMSKIKRFLTKIFN